MSSFQSRYGNYLSVAFIRDQCQRNCSQLFSPDSVRVTRRHTTEHQMGGNSGGSNFTWQRPKQIRGLIILGILGCPPHIIWKITY